MLGSVLTSLGIFAMRMLAFLPLRLIRGLGHLLGLFLHAFVGSRRHVVHTNLALCFPELSDAARRQLARQTFIYFAQAWLDRAWLWHAPLSWVRRRLNVTGAVNELQGNAPTVIFAPHFVGIDAGWAALALQVPRLSTTIYTDQSNKGVDRWILQGRQRFGNLRLFGRADGVKPIVGALRAGQPLYLLADMNFGLEESVFVPFFGVQAATVPSLSRFARLGRAKVLAALAHMTDRGYELRLTAAWPDFPSGDAVADTARMNACLEQYIAEWPAQYYWVHKRFKTRPEGEPSVY
ncbi:MAG: lipid A biosynthesis acyltransferase [Polaromonas sp.]|nr:lipid A biosynthesis acyltransferase [Polaromonas sp.]